MSRRAAVKRADSDLKWRGAMGVPLERRTPSERTVRDFEKFLAQRDPRVGLRRSVLVHEHIVRTCLEQGLGATGAKVATDSTPLWCYGAVKDTVRLLGEGVCDLARLYAQATGQHLPEVAEAWQLPWLLAKSIKGAFAIDWRSEKARSEVVSELAEEALLAVERVRRDLLSVRPSKRKKLLRRARHLVRIVRDDLEADKAGKLVIAERVAKDRMISLSDPQARRGHKSRKQSFDGFKTHVVGDLTSGLILSLCVTSGNEHDGRPAHRLIRRAKEVMPQLKEVLGDTAYGAARLRYLVRGTLGVSLLCPPVPEPSSPGRLGRSHFQFDLVAKTATCPEGVLTDRMRLVWSSDAGVHVPKFSWPKAACDACPLSAACRGKRTDGQVVLLHPYEADLRKAREQFAQPEVRAQYRARTQCERLMNQIVMHGGRTARAFGLVAAQLQAHCIAMTSNLKLLAAALLRP